MKGRRNRLVMVHVPQVNEEEGAIDQPNSTDDSLFIDHLLLLHARLLSHPRCIRRAGSRHYCMIGEIEFTSGCSSKVDGAALAFPAIPANTLER